MSGLPLVVFPDTGGGGSSNATQLQGYPVSATPPTTTYVLTYNGTNWAPAAAAGGAPTGTAGGGLGGTYPNPTVLVLNGASIPASSGVAVGAIPYLSASNTLSYLTAGAAGTVFIGNGTAAAPSWSTSLSLSSGNITMNGVLGIQGGNTSLVVGSTSYSTSVTVQSGASAPLYLANGANASLAVTRATNAVSWLADAAATSLTIGTTAAASGTGGTTLFAGQDSTTAGGRGNSTTLRGANGDSGGGGSLTVQGGSGVSGGGAGNTLNLFGGNGNGAGVGGNIALYPGTSGSGAYGTVQISGLQYTTASIGVGNINVTLTGSQAANPQLTFTGAQSGDLQIIAPLVAGLRYTLTNNSTGAFSLTFGGATGNVVLLPKGMAVEAVCDGTNYVLYTRTLEFLINVSAITGVTTTNTALCKLPPGFILTIANIRTTTTLVGGATTFALGTASAGATILVATAPGASGTTPLGVVLTQLGTDLPSTNGYVASYPSGATIWLSQAQTTAACTAGAVDVYLGGYVP